MTTYARIPLTAQARSPEPYAGERDLPRSLHPYERRILARLAESPDHWESAVGLAWLCDLDEKCIIACLEILDALGLVVFHSRLMGYRHGAWRLSEEGERLCGVER